jgi:hypothetical protein
MQYYELLQRTADDVFRLIAANGPIFTEAEYR